MAKLTKKRKAALEKINSEMTYEVDVALGLVKDHATANFPESVDLSVNLGVDPVSYTHLTLPTILLV